MMPRLPLLPRRGFWRSYWGTLLLCLMLLCCALPGLGFGLFFYGIPAFVFAARIYINWDEAPEMRPVWKAKLAMLAASLGIVCALHPFYAWAAREDAARTIRQIEAYKTAQGRLPGRGEIRIEHAAWLPFSPASYFISFTAPHEPYVVYQSTWCAFVTHWYNLESRTWTDSAI